MKSSIPRPVTPSTKWARKDNGDFVQQQPARIAAGYGQPPPRCNIPVMKRCVNEPTIILLVGLVNERKNEFGFLSSIMLEIISVMII